MCLFFRSSSPPSETDFLFRSRQNCYLINLSISLVMGIADLPCSGYVRDEGMPHYYMDVSVFLFKTLPGRQHAIAKKGDQARLPNGNVMSSGTVKAIQPGTKRANDQRRPKPTTSTVSRPRSGWCGFSNLTGGLPGPLGSVLGR